MSFKSWVASVKLARRLPIRSQARRNCPLTLDLLEDRSVPALLTVNTLLDGTNHADSLLTLREALEVVNLQTTGQLSAGELGQFSVSNGALGANDTIAFVTALNGTITLTGGELPVRRAVFIKGPGIETDSSITVDANNASRVFNVDDLNVNTAKNVTVSDLDLLNGNVGVLFGGAIRNTENLTLIRIDVTQCVGQGAVYSESGMLTLDHSEVSSNSVTGDNTSGGGVYASGGTLTISNSTISGNKAIPTTPTGVTYGGGVIVSLADLVTITNTEIADNAAVFGGGVYCLLGPIKISNCTLSGNVARNLAGTTQGLGGGFYNAATATVVNSTFEGNDASGDGGGLFNDGGSALTIINCSIARNVANSDRDLAGSGGGIWTFNDAAALTTIKNTIVAGNERYNAAGSAANDLANKNVEAGSTFNIIGDAGTAGGLANGVNGNLVGNAGNGTLPIGNVFKTDINGVPLFTDINGGPTPTFTLAAASLALNAGSNANIPAGVTQDQRGLARISGPSVDIGSVERQLLTGPYVVSNASDDDGAVDGNYSTGQLTLREAVLLANDHAGPDTISYAAGVGSIALTVKELSFTDAAKTTVNGSNGVVVTTGPTGSSQFSIFRVLQAAVDFNNLTVGSDAGEGFYGIENVGGTVAINNCTITGNLASGIRNSLDDNGSTSTITIYGSTISDNGGGISGGGINGGGISNGAGTITVVNTTISGNSTDADGDGGGVFNADIATIVNSTVTNNRAGLNGSGGGISTATGAQTTIKNTIVAGNFKGAGSTRDDVDGSLVATSSNNLIGDGTGLTGIANGVQGNKIGTVAAPINPLLGALANNGGPTKTHALLTNSPAINAGSNANIPTGITTDQRGTGFARISGVAVDIGAYELATVAKTDIIGRYAEAGQWYVGKSNGTSFTTSYWGTWSPGVTWTDVQTGDFNGDGLQDIVGRYKEAGQWYVGLSNGTSFVTSYWGGWSPGVTWADVKVGDFNGDGKSDIVGRYKEAGQWYVGLSTGTSFATSYFSTWSPGVTWTDVNVGDFDGNGKADIVGRYKEAGQWYVGKSTGTSFTTSYFATWSPGVTWADVKVADFNADGKSDIVGRYAEAGQWYAGISNGTSFGTAYWGSWSAINWVDVSVGDFNGDGKPDIAGRWKEAGQWWVSASTGTSFATSYYGSWSVGVTWADVKVGDFDGDGKSDLVARYKEAGQWYVARSTGAGFVNQYWGAWSNAVTWADVAAANLAN